MRWVERLCATALAGSGLLFAGCASTPQAAADVPQGESIEIAARGGGNYSIGEDSPTDCAGLLKRLKKAPARQFVFTHSDTVGDVACGAALAQQSQGKVLFRDADGNIPAHIAALFKTIEQGAATTVWCATSRQLDGMGGVYCEDCDIAEALPADTKELRGVMPWAMDTEAAARLWTLSERLLGITFA